MTKTFKEDKIGKSTLRVVQTGAIFTGIIVSGEKIVFKETNANPDALWNILVSNVGTTNPNYFGYDDAKARFLKFFPEGFNGEDYIKTERNYKIDAKNKLENAVPLEIAITCTGMGVEVLRTFQATNVVFSVEKTRLSELLKGSNADAFIHASAAFANGGGAYALKEIEKILKFHNVANWTAATYLPYLWKPDTHMFLKPEVTKDYAARVGHRFQYDYQSSLEYDVYESLLDLTAQTKQNLTTLNPRDNIDIQSFIWVIGGYKDEWMEKA